ncbi:MAG: ADP-ribosylglycohydrolase family protein, partial [Bacteroidales bacterium]|nr:ADP-ribosylglycohydrolase family protein [Bacteroidales bacterium]
MVKGIIGAVIGDIAGSSRESKPVSRKTFKLFTKDSSVTDDTALTVAIAEWMLDREGEDVGQSLIKWATEYPHAGYGSSFKRFLSHGSHMTPGSTHNGAVMRVSPVGFLASSLEECLELSRESALPSHDSPQAVAGAQAAAAAIYMARTGSSKDAIREFLEKTFGYNLHRSYDEVREEVRLARANRDIDYEASHERIIGAEPAVQDALIAFLAGSDYEDVIRKAIYLGGDADTEAAIAGGIAAAYYGVPEELIQEALIYIPSDMLAVINQVDGTSWKPSKLIPPKSSRWSVNDVVICGCNAEETDGERAFHLTRPSRFRRHPNEGYPIHVTGLQMDKTLDQIWVLRRKCEDYKHIRWHLHEVGIESGTFTVEQFRELFSWAL